MKLSDFANDLNGKRLTVTLESNNISSHIFSEKAKVFVRQSESKSLVFMNSDWEEISVSAKAINSIRQTDYSYVINCDNCRVIAEF